MIYFHPLGLSIAVYIDHWYLITWATPSRCTEEAYDDAIGERLLIWLEG